MTTNLISARHSEMTKNYLKEACIETLEEALAAERLGADRLEYCSCLAEDGLSPDLHDIEVALEKVSIPITVMIRPRAGNFVYSDAEFEAMKVEILRFKKLKIQGVVFGLLSGQCIDFERTRTLAELAAPLEVCFHKAIDEVEDPVRAIKKLNKIPALTRVLTSGQKPTAMEGLETLAQMMKAARSGLSIMPAGKVTGSNIDLIHEKLNASEYHGRSIVVNI